MDKIKVTAVSYLNTKPLLYGILNSPIADKIDLQLDIPSVCARKLNAGEADLGLIPVAAIPELDAPEIVTDYCIGTTGSVKTVCIYGDCSIEDMEAIYLDYHSRTSVELTKLLLKEYWKLNPKLIPASPGFQKHIGGTTGGLIIGDRTIGMDEKYSFVYDLGDIWKKHTGLSFVFAAWVSNRPLPADFLKSFNEAMKKGVEAIPQLIMILPQQDFDLESYFTNNISYSLDMKKRESLSIFLKAISGGALPKTTKNSLVC
jgi:chorismate dehydratase